MKFWYFYDNGSGWLELGGEVTAKTPEEAAKKAAEKVPYGYAAVTALGHDPERDGRDVILAEAVASPGMAIFNFDFD